MSFNINYNCFAKTSRVSLLLVMCLLLGVCQCNILDSEQFNSSIEIVDLLTNDAESKGDSSDNSENDLQKEKSNHNFSIKLYTYFAKNMLSKNEDVFTLSKYRDVVQPPPESLV